MTSTSKYLGQIDTYLKIEALKKRGIFKHLTYKNKLNKLQENSNCKISQQNSHAEVDTYQEYRYKESAKKHQKNMTGRLQERDDNLNINKGAKKGGKCGELSIYNSKSDQEANLPPFFFSKGEESSS